MKYIVNVLGILGALSVFFGFAALIVNLAYRPQESQPGGLDWYPVWDHGVMCYTWRPMNEDYPIAMSCMPIEDIPAADYLWPNWRESVRHTYYRDLPHDGSSLPYFKGTGTIIPGPTVLPNPGAE